MLIRSGAIDVIVVDSVAALVPKAEIEGEMGEAQMGLQARLMSQALRKLTAIVSKSRTSLIFINQIREKIGVLFGNPETTTGGRALKFYSSIRIDIRRIASLKDGDVVVGSRTKLKSSRQGGRAVPAAEFDIRRDGSRARGAHRQGHRAKCEKSGRGCPTATGIGRGARNAKQFLRDTRTCTVEKKLRLSLGLAPSRALPRRPRRPETRTSSEGKSRRCDGVGNKVCTMGFPMWMRSPLAPPPPGAFLWALVSGPRAGR